MACVGSLRLTAEDRQLRAGTSVVRPTRARHRRLDGCAKALRGATCPLNGQPFVSRRATWSEGGGYCLVWDLNGDGVFDGDGEPVLCSDNILKGAVNDVILSS